MITRLNTWIDRIRSKPQSVKEINDIHKAIRQMNYRRIIVFSIVTAIFESGLILFYDIPQLTTDTRDDKQQYLYLFLHGWMLLVALSNLVRLRRVRHDMMSKVHERVAYTTRY